MITLNRDVNKQVKEYIRSMGQNSGYPLLLVMRDGGCLCHHCAKREFKLIIADTRDGWSTDWTAAGVESFFEGADVQCSHCNAVLTSAYGDPYANDDESEILE